MSCLYNKKSGTNFHASVQPETNGCCNNLQDSCFRYLDNRRGNVSIGDGMKLRGQGMKQLASLKNYAKY